MDMKRPLVTQLPSQTEVGDTTTLYIYSRPIGLRFEFDRYEEATFDPSSVLNGCCDQRVMPTMDHSHVGLVPVPSYYSYLWNVL
eukprot:scaffold83836_cov69-Attheya_sp.AAC.2